MLTFLKQNTTQRRELILTGAMTPTILMLSVPALLMGLVQAAIPIVDGLFINNIVGTIAASAVHYCAPIVGMFGALAQGLSVAGMAIIGQANGKGNFADARRISTQITVISFLAGVIMIPMLIAASYPVSRLVNAEIAGDVFIYLTLNALILPFSFIGAIYNAIRNAGGRPEDPFIRMIIMLGLKIVFNALFIAVLKGGITGAVLASLASNVCICVWMYEELFIKKGSDRLTLKRFRFDRQILREIAQIAFPSILSSLILNLGFFLINNEVQKYGASVLTGAGIASSISNIGFLLPSAFGAAVTTLVSMNIGAGREDRARSACRQGCIVSSITSVILIILVVPLSPRMTILFTRQAEVLTVANTALSIYFYAILGFGICMVLQGAFIGLGRTRVTVVISILRVWLLRYVFILITERYLGYQAVFWGSLFSNYATALITVLMILKVRWVSVIPFRKMEKTPAEE